MTDTITIRISGTPSRALSPNGSTGHHWAKVRDEKKKLQWLTKDALCRLDPFRSVKPPVSVSITVAWEKGRKRMDSDNLLASMKTAIDLIAAAIEVNDKHFVYQPIEQVRDKNGVGYMIVELRGAA